MCGSILTPSVSPGNPRGFVGSGLVSWGGDGTGIYQFVLRSLLNGRFREVNPLSPKSDQHQISLCTINAL